MKDKKNVVIGLLCVAVCIMAVGYAAFSTVLNINGTASVTSTWDVEFINMTVNKTATNTGTAQNPVYTTSGDITHSYTGTTANFDVALISPSDSVVYTITVKNKGTIPAIVNDIIATELGSDAIEFSISGISKGDTLAVNEQKNFTVTVTYKSSVTGQPALTDNQLTVSINYVQNLGQSITPTNVNIEPQRLYSKIMQAYTPVSDASIDFNYTSEGRKKDSGPVTASQVTNGLYYTSDLTKTENGQRVYYFRGNVTNNYVKFGTVNGSCTYNGVEVSLADISTLNVSTITNESDCHISDTCMLPGVVIDQITGGSGNGDGYVVGEGVNEACSQLGGTLQQEADWLGDDLIWRIVRINEDGSIRMITQSPVAQVAYDDTEDGNGYYTNVNYVGSPVESDLNAFYTNNLQQYNSLIADAGFCNDTSIYKVENDDTYYGAYGRLDDNKTPQYKCAVPKLTLNSGLTKKIGLLSADEAAYAGLVSNVHLNFNYLISGVNEYSSYVLASPIMEDFDMYGEEYFFFIISTGFWNDPSGLHNTQVFATISLIPNVEVAIGSGTASDPWVIKTN